MTEFSTTGYLDMDLLRFTTAGSVDDGKSTLIGRLLYDSKSIFDDQYEAIQASSEKRGEEYVNLALLTDGLRAEREQGITIDVAYRYFATPKRKFIIADTPGHIQYTRNMVTGASTANLAIILIDARKGVIEQTQPPRHHRVAAAHPARRRLRQQDGPGGLGRGRRSRASARTSRPSRPGWTSRTCISSPSAPCSATTSWTGPQNMPWYDGPTLLSLLETVHIASDVNHADARFPVQYVIRPAVARSITTTGATPGASRAASSAPATP